MLSRVGPEKGLLRSFLMRALQYFLANEYDRSQAIKRGGGVKIVSMDDQLIDAEAAVVAAGQDDKVTGCDQNWALTLFSQAWDRLYETMVAEGKHPLVDALKPFVVGGAATPPDQGQTAAKLGIPISTFRNDLRRLRLRYRESIRAEIARTVSRSSEIDEELKYLLRLLL